MPPRRRIVQLAPYSFTLSGAKKDRDQGEGFREETMETACLLSNAHLTLDISLPGVPGNYCGARFSWAGIITDITCGGHHLFGPWQPGSLCPELHDNVSGTAGEFGMGTADMPPPLGFDAAAPGEGFVKIGVGVLRRPDERPYEFSGAYERLDSPPWQTDRSDSHIAMRQQLSFNGFGYDYTHTIELDPETAAFTTRHRLTNTGDKPIHQTHYSHNFLVLNRQSIGPGYEISFPFTPDPGFDADSPARLNGNTLTFSRPLSQPVFAMLEGFNGTAVDNGATVRHRDTGVGIRITGDQPIVRYHFFAAPGAICPEPFVEMRLSPGQTMTWQHRYDILGAEKHPST